MIRLASFIGILMNQTVFPVHRFPSAPIKVCIVKYLDATSTIAYLDGLIYQAFRCLSECI